MGRIPSRKAHPIIRICCRPPLQPRAFPGDGSCTQMPGPIPFHCREAGRTASDPHFFLPAFNRFVCLRDRCHSYRPGRPLPEQDSLPLGQRAFTHGARGPVHPQRLDAWSGAWLSSRDLSATTHLWLGWTFQEGHHFKVRLLRPSPSSLQDPRKEIDGDGKHDGRVLLRGNLRESLQVSELEGRRVRGDDLCRLG